MARDRHESQVIWWVRRKSSGGKKLSGKRDPKIRGGILKDNQEKIEVFPNQWRKGLQLPGVKGNRSTEGGNYENGEKR